MIKFTPRLGVAPKPVKVPRAPINISVGKIGGAISNTVSGVLSNLRYGLFGAK